MYVHVLCLRRGGLVPSRRPEEGHACQRPVPSRAHDSSPARFPPGPCSYPVLSAHSYSTLLAGSLPPCMHSPHLLAASLRSQAARHPSTAQ